MNKLLALIGPSDITDKLHPLLTKELDGTIDTNVELLSVLSEVYKTDVTKFKGPVRITDGDMRLFFQKMGRGVHPAKNGPTLNTFEELLNYYKKLGSQRFGDDWIVKSLSTKIEEPSTGVYLVVGLSKEETLKAKSLLEDSFLVVEVIPDLPKPKKGEQRQIAEVLSETDLTIKNKQTEDGIKREVSKLLAQIKTKQKEINKDDKPKFRITQRQFRPWDA